MLKRLALHSIRTFDAEVKQGKRDALSVDELADTPIRNPSNTLAEIEYNNVERRKDKMFKGRESAVKQTKIVRQTERVDPITGKGKSKGYGFVEMYHHSDALKFLRWANNNPNVGELLGGAWWKDELESLLKVEMAKDETIRDNARLKRLKDELGRVADSDNKATKKSRGTLIVEFSIENVQVVQRRNANLTNLREKTVVCPPKISVTRRDRFGFSQLSPSTETKERKRKDIGTTRNSNDRPTKIRRVSKMEPINEKSKFAGPIGSIIGRKRKERKTSF